MFQILPDVRNWEWNLITIVEENQEKKIEYVSTSKPRCYLGFVAQTQLWQKKQTEGETQVCIVGVGV